MNTRSKPALRALAALCLGCIGVALGVAAPAKAITGNNPVVVVLCNFSNQTQQPNPPSYYEAMYSDAGAGQLGALDYWRDVSYGTFSVTGTVVKGWYTLGITRDAWVAQSRIDKWKSCAARAKPDVDYTKFAGAIVVFPEAEGRTAAAIDASATSVAMTSLSVGNAANFPTPPFLTTISNCCDSAGNPANVEVVKVTAVSGTTLTLERGQSGTMAVAHPASSLVQVGGDLFGFGPSAQDLAGTTYTVGGALGAHDIPLSVMGHEEGHLFGINHSRAISQAPSDYFDCYDLMSTLTCGYTFGGAGSGTVFGGSTFGGTGKGPGLNSIQVDLLGWLPTARKTTFDNSSCRQSTYTMAALNHAEKSGFQQVRIPAAVPIAKAGGGTLDSDYYAIELRSESGWDRGIPADAFVLYLRGSDGVSYLVDEDSAGLPVGNLGDGGLRAGRMFIDTSRTTYIAVNSIDATDFTGVVTVGGCRIDATLTYSGNTSAVYHRQAVLAGDLKVAGTTAPVPGVDLTFTLGTQSCTGETDAAGHAFCAITVDQVPGAYTVNASFGGNAAYDPVTGSAAFTIERAPTTLAYTGPTVILQGSSGVTLSAVLLEDGTPPVAPVPAGQSVELGVGGQTCTGTVLATGAVSCSLTFTGNLGDQPLSATFAGDAYYLPSSDTGRTAVVFAFPSRGAFVLGDATVAAAGPSTTVTWWDDAWWSLNSLTAGVAPLSFKGFAGTVTTLPTSSPVDDCGTSFTTLPGNSPPPTAGVPGYMGVLVAGSVTKAGNTISGDWAQIVVVKTDPGYAPRPGRAGTGTVVAVFCS